MLDNTSKWSHARGNTVVPSRWQATLDVLLTFYDYPAEHWIHLRTTNPIESTFATVRLRQRVTKGPGSRAAGVAMAFSSPRLFDEYASRLEGR